ncbi:MAG: LysM peptidoglycan-binding domain-containing protein [Bacteroidia bacterium]|nr:LysM peptidoglycan-binding domain-containing protein [Bacteroidia bacterium]
MKNRMRILLLCFSLLFFTGLSAQNEVRKVVNGKTYIVHKVKSGETLYGLAKKYNCTVAQLKEANTNAENLKAGGQLLIPTKEKAVSATPVVTPAATSTNTKYKIHKVTAGQTLSAIARQYNTTVDEIKKINSLSSTSLKVGQEIKVPNTGAAQEVVVKVEEPQTEEPVNVAENAPAKPAEIKVEPPTEKPAENKPSNPRTASNNKDSGKQIAKPDNGGMPRTAEVLAETATEKEETGTAVVVNDKMDQSRTFVMHPTLPKGSIIVIVNESTGKMAYCRVVDNIRPNELNGASVAITKTVADKLGIKDGKGSIKIKYAAP